MSLVFTCFSCTSALLQRLCLLCYMISHLPFYLFVSPLKAKRIVFKHSMSSSRLHRCMRGADVRALIDGFAMGLSNPFVILLLQFRGFAPVSGTHGSHVLHINFVVLFGVFHEFMSQT